MKKRGFIILCFCVLLLSACGSNNSRETSENCLDNEPEHVSGLKIEGERTERNVIHNMWPVVCQARKIYMERLKEKPGFKGKIELKMRVEFNGEIGAYSISRSNMNDKDFETRVLRLFQFMDFDPYGPHNSETEIHYPIHFNPQ